MLEPMPRDRYRRRNAMHDLIMAVALLLFVIGFILIARHAHAAPDASAVLDPSMQMPVVAPVQLVTAAPPAATTPEWLASLERIMARVLTLFMMALLGLLIKETPAIFRKVHELLDAKVQNVDERRWLSRLTDAAATVTEAVEQSMMKSLDAKVDPKANAAAAKNAAMVALKTTLGGDAGLNELKYVLNLSDDKAVDEVLSTTIESAVHQMNVNKEEVKS